MNGLDIETMLKEKLWTGNDNLGMPISDIRTTICQNKCSGHGVCNADTRACMCDTFWMPNLYYFWGISQANCGKNHLNYLKNLFAIGTLKKIFLFRLVNSLCCHWSIYNVHDDISNLLGINVLLQNIKASNSG